MAVSVVIAVVVVSCAGSEAVTPRFYQDPAFPPTPLPPAAVRLLLVLLSEAVPAAAPVGTEPLPPAAAVAAAAAAAPAAAAAGAVGTEPAAAAAAESAMRAVNSSAIEAAVSITGCVQALLPAGCKVSNRGSPQ